jgi:hypothetical protein
MFKIRGPDSLLNYPFRRAVTRPGVAPVSYQFELLQLSTCRSNVYSTASTLVILTTCAQPVYSHHAARSSSSGVPPPSAPKLCSGGSLALFHGFPKLRLDRLRPSCHPSMRTSSGTVQRSFPINSFQINSLRTLCQKHPGWGDASEFHPATLGFRAGQVACFLQITNASPRKSRSCIHLQMPGYPPAASRTKSRPIFRGHGSLGSFQPQCARLMAK